MQGVLSDVQGCKGRYPHQYINNSPSMHFRDVSGRDANTPTQYIMVVEYGVVRAFGSFAGY